MSTFAADFFHSYRAMKHIEDFSIPLLGTHEGVSEHSFTLNSNFFESFEDSEIQDSDIKVVVKTKKGIDIFELDFSLHGDVTIDCDRCLDPMVQDIEHKANLIVKYGDKYEEIDDKVVTIAPSEENINVASFIYEYAKLALPIQHSHDIEDCNDEMIEQISKYERKEEEEKEVDSRWNALADLKDKIK